MTCQHSCVHPELSFKACFSFNNWSKPTETLVGVADDKANRTNKIHKIQ